MTPYAALGLLIAYMLLQIHIALKAHTTRVFQIAFAGIGGTEKRLVYYAEELTKNSSAGQALVNAKRRYLSTRAGAAVYEYKGNS